MRKLEVSNKAALRAVLKEELLESKEFRFFHRVHCVLLVGEGCSCYDLAGWFGENPRTIERWVHYYEEFGVEGLRDEHRPGRPAKLGYNQLKSIAVDVCNRPTALGYSNTHWDGHLLSIHVQKYYGVQLGVRQCQRILHRLQAESAVER